MPKMGKIDGRSHDQDTVFAAADSDLAIACPILRITVESAVHFVL